MVLKNIQLRWLLFFVVLLGAGLRFQGINWDEGYHLQPDERYISMALSQLDPPKSWGEYLDPSRSPLSPYINNFGAYIYGQLPLTVLTYLSRWAGMEGYDRTYLLGRGISAMLDTLSIVLVYKLGKRLWNEKTGLIGAAFYAFAPLAIQYSHFMTMESWVTFFWLMIILLLLEGSEPSNWKVPNLLMVGILLGAAMAVKASSIVLMPLVLGGIAVGSIKVRPWRTPKRVLLGSLGSLGILGVTVALSFRFFQPTIFQSASWLDWSLRQDFYQAFNFQRLAIEGKVMFPPQWQWVGTARWWFPLKNIVLWGIGPAAGGLAAIGVIREIGEIRVWKGLALRRKARPLFRLALAVWIAAVFFWQGGKFVKNMRYFLPFFPLYALFAADFIRSLLAKPGDSWLRKLFLMVALVSAGVWAIMFTNIYRLPTTRVMASEWIYQNIPAGSKIMLEEWDDPLPLFLPGYEMFGYQTEMVGVYAVDDEKKKEQINQWTEDFDWIVLSSSRAKGSIGKLPNEFPLMSKFYRDLDNGSLGFVKAAEFVSYPSLKIVPQSGIPLRGKNWELKIDDSSAEESFWVYDHPRVEIYKKS